MNHQPRPVAASQNAAHQQGHDYVTGSPHLRHDVLRDMIEAQLRRLVRETIERKGSCHVLEVGAGHGTFTAVLLAAGATVTVTEVSEASADHLAATYAGRDDVEVFFDSSGEDVFAKSQHFDGVVCAALLHHIPDYVTFVRRLAALVEADGWFYSTADPTYYPRRTRWAHLADRGTFYVWRLGQGNIKRGIATHVRRFRGEWSPTEPSDLVEYHVVRDGVDELALAAELERWFADVQVLPYWSTQSPFFQKLLARADVGSDFSLVAQARTTTTPPSDG